MYNGKRVIDVHGHLSAPPQLRAYESSLIHNRTTQDPAPEIPDEAMEKAAGSHLHYISERNIDVQLISPRPVGMMHWEQARLVERWTSFTNDTIHRFCGTHPGRFVGIAQLPQNVQIGTANCVAELERCVKELGFVGAIVNPDPGADRQAPGVDSDYWFPLYEKAQALGTPLLVHPSISRDPRITLVPHNYQINNVVEEFIATLILQHSEVFKTFPRLRVIVCHCGGALSRFIPEFWDRWEKQDLSQNLFFDTCAYNEHFLAAAIREKGVDQMVFGTEAPGSGRAIRSDTGRASDDLIPVIDTIDFLSLEDKMKIFRENALRVYTGLEVE